MLLLTSRLRPAPQFRRFIRCVSTLPSNPHIKVFPNTANPGTYLLTYLNTEPPDHNLAIGTTTAVPPTPNSFRENRRFLQILNDVLAEHAQHDQDLISQARAFAGPGGAMLGSGGAFFPQTNRRQRTTKGGSGGAGGTGAGGASGQGGAGGGGKGGWVHLSDKRNPPDYGRIAWPEDILGSVEVDGHGDIIGNFQPSGTYRIITNEGILGLSDYLRKRLVSRLQAEEGKSKVGA